MRQRYLFRLWMAALLAGLLVSGRPACAATKAGHEVRKVGHKVAFGYNRTMRDYHYRRARAERHHGHRTKARKQKKQAFGYHRKAVKHKSEAR